jgi:hypothetical protein
MISPTWVISVGKRIVPRLGIRLGGINIFLH